jgi:hypothetical protein
MSRRDFDAEGSVARREPPCTTGSAREVPRATELPSASRRPPRSRKLKVATSNKPCGKPPTIGEEAWAAFPATRTPSAYQPGRPVMQGWAPEDRGAGKVDGESPRHGLGQCRLEISLSFPGNSSGASPANRVPCSRQTNDNKQVRRPSSTSGVGAGCLHSVPIATRPSRCYRGTLVKVAPLRTA